MKASAFFITAIALAISAGFIRSAQAQDACTSDDDCAADEYCLYPPCAQPCDPDGESCEPVECPGSCVVDEQPWDEECASSDDCTDGWVCEVVGGTACAGVACPDNGEPCPEPEPCEPEEIRACVPPPPAPCASDADCEDGLVCVTYDYSTCPAGQPDCPPGSDCPEPQPVECESTSESYCVPSYFAPCEVDADCGAGFACVQGEMCGCSAGGSTGGGSTGGTEPGDPDAGSGDTGTEPECVCEPTGDLYCELQQMPCQDDSACPEGFGCELLPAPAVPCSYDEETGETICDEPSGEPTDGQCVPADWMAYYAGAPATSGNAYDEAVGGALGGGGEATAEGRADNFPPVTPGPDDTTTVSGGSAGGCQTAGGTGSAGLALPVIGVLAFLLVGARRRWL